MNTLPYNLSRHSPMLEKNFDFPLDERTTRKQTIQKRPSLTKRVSFSRDLTEEVAIPQDPRQPLPLSLERLERLVRTEVRNKQPKEALEAKEERIGRVLEGYATMLESEISQLRREIDKMKRWAKRRSSATSSSSTEKSSSSSRRIYAKKKSKSTTKEVEPPKELLIPRDATVNKQRKKTSKKPKKENWNERRYDCQPQLAVSTPCA